MATTEHKEGSIHQDEYPSKAPNNPMFKGVSVEKQQIYLSYAAKDEEWKTFHTKKLLRKVDFRLLPLLVMMYLLNFLDRSNLAQARLGTLEEDLGMTGTDFNLATSILFVVSCEIPQGSTKTDGFRDTYSCNSPPTSCSPASAHPFTSEQS
jgi:hypothetical protein